MLTTKLFVNTTDDIITARAENARCSNFIGFLSVITDGHYLTKHWTIYRVSQKNWTIFLKNV